jgi:hypothetical protein
MNSLFLVQRELLKIRFRWTDTDNAGDNELDIDEFLAFRHPEIAGRSYKYIVEDIISQMGLFVLFFLINFIK